MEPYVSEVFFQLSVCVGVRLYHAVYFEGETWRAAMDLYTNYCHWAMSNRCTHKDNPKKTDTVYVRKFPNDSPHATVLARISILA